MLNTLVYFYIMIRVCVAVYACFQFSHVASKNQYFLSLLAYENF